MENFFLVFDLPWSDGEYCRWDFQLNPSADLLEGTAMSSIPVAYSMKAKHVRYAGARQRVYVCMEDTRPAILGFSPEEVDMEQTAVAAARVGRGDLIYCGDMNPEAGSTCLILALCGFQAGIETDPVEAEAVTLVIA